MAGIGHEIARVSPWNNGGGRDRYGGNHSADACSRIESVLLGRQFFPAMELVLFHPEQEGSTSRVLFPTCMSMGDSMQRGLLVPPRSICLRRTTVLIWCTATGSQIIVAASSTPPEMTKGARHFRGAPFGPGRLTNARQSSIAAGSH